jgi:hypothetical protein
MRREAFFFFAVLAVAAASPGKTEARSSSKKLEQVGSGPAAAPESIRAAETPASEELEQGRAASAAAPESIRAVKAPVSGKLEQRRAEGAQAPAPLPDAEAPSLEKLEAGRLSSLVAAGFSRSVLGGEADRLVLYSAGSGTPLIFLHGVGNRGSLWFEVAPAFASAYRVLVPDLPGHGESAPSSGDLPMATVVAGAERLLAEAAASSGGRPAIVVGNSMGAWLAAILAQRHPDQVARIVLVNGGPLPGDPGGPSLLPATREEAAKLMAMLRDPSAPPLPDWLRRSPTGCSTTSCGARRPVRPRA